MKFNQRIKIPALLITLIFLITFAEIIPQVIALTWSTDTQLTTDTNSDFSSAMTQTADKRLWLFWHESLPSGTSQIFYKTYNGTWSADTQFTTGLSNNVQPKPIQSRDGKIWVFWSSDRNGPTGNWEIYYRTSSNNGASWSADSRLTMDVNVDDRPSVMQAQDGTIWVAWRSNRAGNYEVFYTTYDGAYWTSFGIQLTDSSSINLDPAIIQTHDSKIWVFFSSYRTGDYNLWYKTSTDNGLSWSTDSQLTSGVDWDEASSAVVAHSAVPAQDGKIWLTWQRESSKLTHDIYYKTFNGATWSSDTSLVTGTPDYILPSIFQSANTTIWVTWSQSNSDFDIYYKRTLADYDVAVTNVVSTSNLAYKGYSRQVQVKVRNTGLQSATFTVTAYYNSTSIGTQAVTSLAPNTDRVLNFSWSTTGVSYGYYVLSANASAVTGEEDLTDNSLVGNTVMVTIPGDVNGDKGVDVLDRSQVSAHWSGPPAGPSGYSVTCDINNDGKIDINDRAIVSSHWGQSWLG